MSSHFKVWFWILTVVLSASNLSCTVSKDIVTVGVSPSPEIESFPTELITPAPTLTVQVVSTNVPLASVTENVPITQILSVVTITANGNLFIRRGPDVAYNAVSVLVKGESATALARDVLAKWVQIPIPGQPGKTGWVSIQTGYSVVNGNVAELPEIQTTDWPVASYLRNCTYHQMIVKPGDIILPSLGNSPENEVWIYPGVYKVYDLDVPGEPEVLAVEMQEGISIDIREDGNGEKRKCP